jgi:hypothetical protein
LCQAIADQTTINHQFASAELSTFDTDLKGSIDCSIAFDMFVEDHCSKYSYRLSMGSVW